MLLGLAVRGKGQAHDLSRQRSRINHEIAFLGVGDEGEEVRQEDLGMLDAIEPTERRDVVQVLHRALDQLGQEVKQGALFDRHHAIISR